MSSDYYGAVAGELADRQAAAVQQAHVERGFLIWVNELTRHEATLTHYEQLQAAFYAGFHHAGTAPLPEPPSIYACDCTCHATATDAAECEGGCHEFYGRRIHGPGEIKCCSLWCNVCDRDPYPIPHGPEFQTGEPLL